MYLVDVNEDELNNDLNNETNNILVFNSEINDNDIINVYYFIPPGMFFFCFFYFSKNQIHLILGSFFLYCHHT